MVKSLSDDEYLERCKKIAIEKGGECLSKKYTSSKIPLKFKCNQGHEWATRSDRLCKGSWCKKCFYANSDLRKKGFDDILKITKKKNGKCLSSFSDFHGNKSRLNFECDKKHIWETTADSIKSGSWCKYCGGSMKLTIKEMKKLAKDRGGKCLSKKYVNSHTDLKWKCSQKHTWYAEPANVKYNNTWCPECCTRICEKICKNIFELIFNKNFKKKKPRWLKTKKGTLLELDGYCKKLKLAFEYQGIQHYIFSKKFHRSHKKFEKQQKYDKLKRNLCEKKKIKLIEIPYTVEKKDFQKYIIKLCKKNNIKLPKKIPKININKLNIHNDQNRLDEIKKIAVKKGGKCLSINYLGSKEKLDFVCKYGHEWSTMYCNVKVSNAWCPKCGRNQTGKTIHENTIKKHKYNAVCNNTLKLVNTLRENEKKANDIFNRLEKLIK